MKLFSVAENEQQEGMVCANWLKLQTVLVSRLKLLKLRLIQSKIDLAIISNVSASKLCNRSSYREFKERLYAIDTDQEYDRLQFNSLKAIRNSKEPVCLDIISKGKLLYQREGISYV